MEQGAVGLEPRVARIEADVANLKETVTRLDKKFDRLDEKIDVRFLSLDRKIDERFLSLDRKIDDRFLNLDGKVNALNQGMVVMERELRRSLDTKFIWIVTTMIAFGAALLAAMAKGFHWLG